LQGRITVTMQFQIGQLAFRERSIDLGDDHLVELLDIVGSGCFAKVYRARLHVPSGVHRKVAVKVFSSVAHEEDRSYTQLVRTACRVACIDHPGVVRLYDCGLWRAQAFVISELVEGVSLARIVDALAARHARLPLDVALFIACEVAEALSAARTARDHDGVRLGLVHHSVCPREVLLSWRGEVKVTDFEATLARAGSSSIRSLRAVASRTAAMAPEVASGALGDARSDVFSLGVLLHELLLGPRFPVGLVTSDLLLLAREGYIHPLTCHPNLPGDLAAVIARCLALDPAARYPHATALAYELRRVAFGMGVGDGRQFLRTWLAREGDDDEVTTERAPEDDLEDGDYDDEVIPRGGLPEPLIYLFDAPNRRA